MITFTVHPDVQQGEPRLWLYTRRESWPPAFRARLSNGPQPATLHLGDQAIGCTIKAHERDGSRSYVAAGPRTAHGTAAARWPGHRELTRYMRGLGLAAGDSLTTRVVIHG